MVPPLCFDECKMPPSHFAWSSCLHGLTGGAVDLIPRDNVATVNLDSFLFSVCSVFPVFGETAGNTASGQFTSALKLLTILVRELHFLVFPLLPLQDCQSCTGTPGVPGSPGAPGQHGEPVCTWKAGAALLATLLASQCVKGEISKRLIEVVNLR